MSYTTERHDKQETGTEEMHTGENFKVFLNICDVDKLQGHVEWLNNQPNTKVSAGEANQQRI